MAEISTVQQLPAPFIEAAGKTYLSDLQSAIGGLRGADLSKTLGPQFVAPTSAITQEAQALRGGLGSFVPFLQTAAATTGPTAYQQFMSPYQQDVIDASLAEFDRQAAKGLAGIGQTAAMSGNLGGGREGVMRSEYQSQSDLNRALLQSGLLQQGFQQAQAAAAQDLAARQGLGTYQTQLGQQQQAYDQAILDASQIAAREAEFQPFTQLGLIGQQLAQIQPGAFPTQTVGYAPPAAPASPMAQFLGGAAGLGGIAGKLGLFGS